MSVYPFDHGVSQSNQCACGLGLPLCFALSVFTLCSQPAFAENPNPKFQLLENTRSALDNRDSEAGLDSKNSALASYTSLEKTSSADAGIDLSTVTRHFEPIYSYFVGSQKSADNLNIIGVRDGDVWEFEKLAKNYSISRVGKYLPPSDKRLQGFREAVASARLVVAYEINSHTSKNPEIIAIVESDTKLFKVTHPSAATYSIRQVGLLGQSK